MEQGFIGIAVVLGRPGSGCSTLLKVLANQRDEFRSVNGDVYYDSITPAQVKSRCRGDVQYCPEDDVHFPTLTVDQTIHFAAKTRAPQPRIEQVSRAAFTRRVTEIYLTVFGLNHVKGTMVGDASIRGVSGGEKKRVSCVFFWSSDGITHSINNSIAEALATRSLITSWDKYVELFMLSVTPHAHSFHLALLVVLILALLSNLFGL